MRKTLSSSRELSLRTPGLVSTDYRAGDVLALCPSDVIKRVVTDGTGTDVETRVVFHCEFGAWPTPVVDHPDVISISELVQDVKQRGLQEELSEARRTLGSWLYNRKISLRTLRLKAGLSQSDLARLTETSQAQIARLEAGKQDPTLTTLRKLSLALRVDLNVLNDAFHG